MLHNSTRRKGSRLPVRAERTINLFFALSRLARVIISLARFFCLKNARQFVWDLDCLLEIFSNSTFKGFIKQAREKTQKKIMPTFLIGNRSSVCNTRLPVLQKERKQTQRSQEVKLSWVEYSYFYFDI